MVSRRGGGGIVRKAKPTVRNAIPEGINAPAPPDLRKLTTETSNLAAAELDTKSALEIARVMNEEDKKVPLAVERALPQIAQAIDAVAASLGSGGRLIYVGAGTSGRIAALDASECPPTFNVDPKS